MPMHEAFVLASVYQQACRAIRDQFHVNTRMIRRNNVAVRHEIGEASNTIN